MFWNDEITDRDSGTPREVNGTFSGIMERFKEVL